MIAELRIRGIGVIDEAVIEFAPGLTVVTGETGAGKTMVLTGLALLRGAKADAGAVRVGAGQAQADGIWQLAPAALAALAGVIEETGIEVDAVSSEQAELVLGRSVAAEGRSRAFAGGRVVPAAVLERLTDALLAVHGQSDQVRLTDARRQRDLLDRFAGLGAQRDAYAASFQDWRAISGELAALTSARQESDREAALLRLGLAEIDEVQPVAGEDDDLKRRASALANSTDLAELLGRAHELVSESADSALVALGGALRDLDRASALDPSLQGTRDLLAAAAEAVQAASLEIAARAGGADADPGLLEEVELRRQLLAQLKRKFGPTLDDVLAWQSQAQRTVELADTADDRLADLQARIGPAREAVVAAASALSAARGEAAVRLAAQITDELHQLAMADAYVEIGVEQAADIAEYTADGADTVAFQLCPHPGAPLRPVGQGASGGELSRVMLAVEVCLADASPVPTFVFDEVDAGIGGKVAVEVGTRLSRLAQQSQVIVVTHLPQVAAFADRHVVVRKQTDGSVTSSNVVAVQGDERVAELVRMLSGLEGSASGAEHAAELLAAAEAVRGRATPKRTRRQR